MDMKNKRRKLQKRAIDQLQGVFVGLDRCSVVVNYVVRV